MEAIEPLAEHDNSHHASAAAVTASVMGRLRPIERRRAGGPVEAHYGVTGPGAAAAVTSPGDGRVVAAGRPRRSTVRNPSRAATMLGPVGTVTV